MYLRIKGTIANFFLFSLVKLTLYINTIYYIQTLQYISMSIDYTINSVSQQHASTLLYKSVYISQNKNPLVFILL